VWFVAYLVYTVVLLPRRIAPPVIPGLRRLADRRLSGVVIVLWPLGVPVAPSDGSRARFPANQCAHRRLGQPCHVIFGVFLLIWPCPASAALWCAGAAPWILLGLALLGWAFLIATSARNSDDADIPPTAAGDCLRAHVTAARTWLPSLRRGFAHRHFDARQRPRGVILTSAIFSRCIFFTRPSSVVVAHALNIAVCPPAIEEVLLVLVTAATCFLEDEVIRACRFCALVRSEQGFARAPKFNPPVAGGATTRTATRRSPDNQTDAAN